MRKFLFLAFMLLISTPCFAADRYWVCASGNWNNTACWSTATGGAGGASVPNSTTDKAIFDGSSGNATINTTGLGVYDLEIQSTYPNGNQISLGSNNLSVVRHLTINANATSPITNGGGLAILFAGGTAASTWAFNGGTLDLNFRVAGGGAKTMTGNVTINGYVYWSAVSNLVGAAYTMYVQNGWNGASYFNDAATNPTIEINGGTLTGTLPNSTTGCVLKPSVSDIVFDGTNPATYMTQVRESTYLQDVSSTYNIVTTNNVTYFISSSGKMKCGGINWNWMHFTGGTLTLEEDIYVDNFYVNNGTVTLNGDAYKIYVTTKFMHRSTSGVQGTATIEITDDCDIFENGAYSGSGLEGNFTLGSNFIINASGKTVTFYNGYSASSRILFNNVKKMTYVAGTLDTSNITYWQTSSSYEFDINITVPTFELLTQASTTTFSSDFTVGTLIQAAGAYLKIANTKTLTISTNFYVNGTSLATPTISAVSGTGKVDYNGTLANSKVFRCAFTSIDASASAVPVFTFCGSSTTSTNVYAVTGDNFKTLAYASA